LSEKVAQHFKKDAHYVRYELQTYEFQMTTMPLINAFVNKTAWK